MEIAIVILLVMVLGVVMFFLYSIQKQNEALREQVNRQLSEVNTQLLETTGRIGERLDGASQMIGSVQKGLGELGEASKQIYDIGKDIASLQDILQPPKLRGVLGEVFLEELLSQLVPTSCEFQHRFKSGDIVDAVIRIGERLVPVDAKFPLENFRKMLDTEDDEETRARCKRAFINDVKKHIDNVSEKYILPDEGTYDFALMYIPAENVYYEIITKDQREEASISEYAVERRVIPVSPNTIYAYLQVIIFGLKGLQVEKHAEEIIRHLTRLRGDFTRFSNDFEVLGTHLSNATKKYEEAERRLARFEGKLSVTGEIAPSELPPEFKESLPSAEEGEGG